jgi:type II secretory pathway component PulF
VTGTIDASDADAAMLRLRTMGLQVATLQPVGGAARREGRVAARDLITFNQQLEQLTTAGMPLEQGLRLIAADAGNASTSRAATALADELEKGTPPEQAFAKLPRAFPRMYGPLVQAGVRTGQLGPMLAGLGRHLEMLARLRASLVRSLAYPVTVLLSFLIVAAGISHYLMPGMMTLVEGVRRDPAMANGLLWVRGTNAPVVTPPLPWPTNVMLLVGPYIPWAALAVALVVVLMLLGKGGPFGPWVPILGRGFRASALARFFDVTRLGVLAGEDLPTALRLAGDAVREHLADARALVSAVESGKPLTASPRNRLPSAALATIDTSIRRGDLPATLDALVGIYERQAEAAFQRFPTVLAPILLLLVAGGVALVVTAVMMPIADLLQVFLRFM